MSRFRMFSDYSDVTDACCDDCPVTEEEKAAYQIVKIHADFVNKHYGYISVSGTKTVPSWGRVLRQPYIEGLVEVAAKVIEAGRKIEDFVAFHFEFWKNHGNNRALVKFGMGSTPGVGYPSLAFIAKNKGGVLDSFLSNKKYVTSFFRTEHQKISSRGDVVAGAWDFMLGAGLEVTADNWWYNIKFLFSLPWWVIDVLRGELEEVGEEFFHRHDMTVGEFVALHQKVKDRSLKGRKKNKHRDFCTVLKPSKKQRKKYAYTREAATLGVNVEGFRFQDRIRQDLGVDYAEKY